MFAPLALTLVLAAPNAPALPPGHPELPAGHPPITAGKEPPSAEALLQQLDATPDLKKKDKPFDVAAALGKLYYANGRYADAAVYLRQAMDKAEGLKALYRAQRQLAQAARKPLPNPSDVGCAAASEAASAKLEALAREKAQAHEPAAAAACARAALGPVLEAEALLGDSLFLTGEAAAGLAEHERVLALEKDAPDSLYSHAGILLDSKGDSVPALKTARAELTRFLALTPQVPRAVSARKMLARVDEAIAAGGTTALTAKRVAKEPVQAPMLAKGKAKVDAPPALTPQMMEAVQNTEMTPEMVAGLQKLVEQGEDSLSHGQYQAALDAYKRVVPFQPGNGRAKAGMAWALVGLKRPMADRIWTVAVQSDAAAVDHLGDTLAAKGARADAKALWQKLAQSAPDYAGQAGLAAKLR